MNTFQNIINTSSNNQTLQANILSISQEISESDINMRRSKLLQQFCSTIWSFTDIACNICKQLYYKKQICVTKMFATIADIFPSELCELNEIITCYRCANLIKKVPTQSWL